MTPTIDITILPIHRSDGFDQSSLPGLYAGSAPRRAARGRHGDRLVLLVDFEGGARFTSERQKQLLEQLAKGYFRTSGTTTSALRTLAESLNEYVLERNLQGSGRGRHMTARLTMAVIREDLLFLAQSGLTHGFLLHGQKIEHFYNAEEAGRGLGTSRNSQVYFSQAQLTPGSYLILTPHLPEGWNESTLKDATSLQPGALRRRLVSHAGADLTAIILQPTAGSGQLNVLSAAVPQAVDGKAEVTLQEEIRATERKPEASTRVATRPQERPGPPEVMSQSPESTTGPQATSQAPPPQQEEEEAPAVVTAPMDSSSEAPAKPRREKRARPKVGNAVMEAGQSVSRAMGKAGEGLKALAGRLVPSETSFNLPASTMMWIAIAVPLAVVAVAFLTWFNRGRQMQYEAYYEQALSLADYADTVEEPQETFNALQTSLVYLDKAEQYRITDESEALRSQVQGALDQMEGVARLNFQPAITGTLGSSIQITSMVATGTALYMLDGNGGSVQRAWLTGSGSYELDPDFRCGPGPYGGFIVESLVDIAAMPRGNALEAEIVGMDRNGVLLYCGGDMTAVAAPLTTPDSNWGEPRAITLGNDNLYVLDPLTNAVWIYFGENGSFTEAPRFFFASEVPPMQDVIDLAVNNDDLYLLNSDGHVITCTFSDLEEAPTDCVDPAPFTDNQLGQQVAQFPGATFSQVSRTPPPEPSIFFLDPIARSIYHFGLRLTLVRQYRAAEGLPEGLATSFAISPTRAAFLAVGNRVYIAFLP